MKPTPDSIDGRAAMRRTLEGFERDLKIAKGSSRAYLLNAIAMLRSVGVKER